VLGEGGGRGSGGMHPARGRVFLRGQGLGWAMFGVGQGWGRVQSVGKGVHRCSRGMH
jgi:hypothetical protein